jgi:predicted AAA+ superfamily ATPase
MLLRSLVLDRHPKGSFFLWGPRQIGKTALLRATYPSAVWVDLLKTDVYMRYLRHPALLREELNAKPPSGPVIVDEVQKLPALLDEIHWLIENRGIVFGLCGSSARKLRRGHANLLADQPSNKKLVCVCTEARARRTQDGIDILPVTEFLSRLWMGDYAG